MSVLSGFIESLDRLTCSGPVRKFFLLYSAGRTKATTLCSLPHYVLGSVKYNLEGKRVKGL